RYVEVWRAQAALHVAELVEHGRGRAPGDEDRVGVGRSDAEAHPPVEVAQRRVEEDAAGETAARALVARRRRDGAASLDDVRGRSRVEQLVGRRVRGAGHLVAPVSVLWRVAVGPPRVN